jgi:BirA family biotin operon repressor/biotin-[acetyl-CoA-carboxylase] ligase
MRERSSFKLSELRQRVRPFRLHWFARLRSTNDHAAAMRNRKTLFAPAIVLASSQTAGRGRGTNTWWSGAGCITATFVLPVVEHFQPHQVPLIAGLAARGALEELVGTAHIRLKWPNDLLLSDDRKVAGLLCERVQGADLIGIGVNVNVARSRLPRSLLDRAASMRELTGAPVSLNDVVAALARHLFERLARPAEHQFSQLLREYDRHHALPGRRIAVAASDDAKPLAGVCVGLDRMGRLLLRDAHDADTIHRVVAGHVSMC